MEADNKSFLNALATLIVLNIITVAVLAAAFWVIHQDLQDVNAGIAQVRLNAGTQQQLARIDNWQQYIHPYNASLGPSDANVVVVAYSDFQCPFCRTFAQSTHKQLVEEYGESVRIVFKHLPLENIHPEAMIAAIAAQCANRSGHFWEFHDVLFEQQDALGLDTALSLGASLGLGEDFAKCVHGEQTRGEVEQDVLDAQQAGVTGTPMFAVNGEVLRGAQSFGVFQSKIESQLAQGAVAGL